MLFIKYFFFRKYKEIVNTSPIIKENNINLKKLTLYETVSFLYICLHKNVGFKYKLNERMIIAHNTNIHIGVYKDL